MNTDLKLIADLAAALEWRMKYDQDQQFRQQEIEKADRATDGNIHALEAWQFRVEDLLEEAATVGE